MTDHILVPLDGSRRAAAVLPYALTLARAASAPVRLLGVVTARTVHDADGRSVAACSAYLESVAATVRARGLVATTAVRHGNPAREILAASEEVGCELIVVSTHGHTGLGRLRMGGVAHHVVRHARIPTLVVRPADDAAMEDPATITGITVTLDGSDLAEAALPPATRIAAALAIPLRLLRVIPNSAFIAEELDDDWGVSYPGDEEIEHDEEQSATAYLDAIAARLSVSGLEVRTEWQHSVTNRAADMIAAVLEEEPAALAVMASHGRGGVLRWALGSTVEETLDRVRCPILIVRAGTAEAESAIPASDVNEAARTSG
jgi:nucleotide-binding universal stress UspA family protein